jgi:hypothetical protein
MPSESIAAKAIETSDCPKRPCRLPVDMFASCIGNRQLWHIGRAAIRCDSSGIAPASRFVWSYRFYALGSTILARRLCRQYR